MSSIRQIEANRRNAKKSTGPKTEQGKNASRFNAVQHGLAAEQFLVTHEEESEFDAFRDGFFNEHQPTTPTEVFLVEQMVAAAWRIRRLRITEASLCRLKVADHEDNLERLYTNNRKGDYLAHALNSSSRAEATLDNLGRYETRLERAFYKALHELERLRRERPAPQIGFVPRKPNIVPLRPPQPPKPSPVTPEPAATHEPAPLKPENPPKIEPCSPS